MQFFWLFPSLLAAIASAWGPEGHQFVGEVATQYVSEKTLDAVVSMIKSEVDSDGGTCEQWASKGFELTRENVLPVVANWADCVNEDRKSSAATLKKWKWSLDLHFAFFNVSQPTADSCPTFDWSTNNCNYASSGGSEPAWGCNVDAIKHFRSFLHDEKNADPNFNVTRAEALKFIIHLIGDVHQPLHVDYRVGPGAGKDTYGGNSIYVKLASSWHNVFSHSPDLHVVWDDSMIDVATDANSTSGFENFRDAIISELSGNETETRRVYDAARSSSDTGHWAEESATLACTNAFKHGSIVSGDTLQMSYFDENIPVVRRQLGLAGVRLAAALDCLFGGIEGCDF